MLDSARSCEVLVAGPGALTSGAGPAFPSLTSNRPSLVLAWFPRSLPAVARRRRYPAPPPAGPLHEGGDLLTDGCAYCTNPRPWWSIPNPLPVAPEPRAVGALAQPTGPRQRQPHVDVDPRVRGADSRSTWVVKISEPLPPHTRG